MLLNPRRLFALLEPILTRLDELEADKERAEELLESLPSREFLDDGIKFFEKLKADEAAS